MSKTAYTNNSFVGDDGKGARESYKQRPVEISMKSVNDFQTTDNYDPYAHRDVPHPITNTETLVHLLKGALGTGIFAMPNAFYHAGYLVAFIGTIILGSIATYCVHLIVNLHYDLCKWKKVPSMSYPQVAETALESGPRSFHRYAPIAGHMINAFLCAYQIGSSAIYVVFIATNLRALLVAFGIEIDVRLLMVIILLPLVLINWVRELKYLAPLSTLGNVIMVSSIGVICYYIFREPLTLEDKEPNGTLTGFFMFFSTVLFALEAIGVIMPLENEMKTPKDFRGKTGILNRAMVIVVTLYVGMGLAGYIKYGSEIKATITVNLPEGDILAQAAKAMIAVGVFASHALFCYVAIDIMWNQYLSSRFEKSDRKVLYEYVLRTGIVFLTFILAIAIPDLDLFISLVGAFTLSALGIIFPPLLETIYKWNRISGRAKSIMIFKNTFICIVGLAGFIVGTVLSLTDIIKTYTG